MKENTTMTAYGGLPPNTPASSDTPGYYTPRPQISFDVFSEAFNLFKLQMGAWVGAVFLCGVIVMAIGMLGSAVMVGSLAATAGSRDVAGVGIFLFFATYAGMFFVVVLATLFLMGGLIRMALKQVRGETIGVGDLFSVTDVFMPLLGTALLVTIIGSIGSMFFVVPGLIAYGVLMFALPLVVDQRLGPIEAITRSFEMLKNDWLMATLFYFVAGLVGSLGFVACGVGVLFTYPIFILAIVLTYRNYMTGGAPPTVPGSYPPAVPGGYTPQTGAAPLSGGYTPTTPNIPGSYTPPQGYAAGEAPAPLSGNSSAPTVPSYGNPTAPQYAPPAANPNAPTLGDNNHPTLNSQNPEPPKL
jgi:hypothetical protein